MMCTFTGPLRTPNRYPQTSRGNPRSGFEEVVVPLLPDAADPFVQSLCGGVVARRLPLQDRASTVTNGAEAALDERFPHTTSARLRGCEQIVHHAYAGGATGRPHPVDGREAERLAGRSVACEELHALGLGIGDQRAGEREQRVVGRV